MESTLWAYTRGMEQPATSTAQLIQDSQSTTIALPPIGFKGNVMGLLFFAVIWTGFIAIFTAVFLLGGSFTDGLSFEMVIVPLGLLPFWAIGIGLFFFAIQTARRRAVFIVTKSDGLTFSQVGPFRKAEMQWAAASITRIHMDTSGTVVNGKAVMQLAIHAKVTDATGATSEKVTGLMSGRDEAELKWLASTLRDALAIPHQAPQSA